MPTEETDNTISKRDVVKLRARANLLVALLSQSDQHLEWHGKELQRLDEQVRRRDGDLDQLRSELQRRDDDLARLRAELQRRDGDLGQLRAQLLLVVGSRSWRVTKPLRALSRLVKM